MSDARLDVRKTYKLLVNGAFPRSESGRSYEVTSAKGAFLANVAQGSRKDVRDAVSAARGAQAKWWNATAYNRGQVLYRLAEMAESRRDELAEHVALSEGVNARTSQKDRLSVDRSHRLVRRVDRQDRPGPRRDQPRGRTVLQLLDPGTERRRGRRVRYRSPRSRASSTRSSHHCASATPSSPSRARRARHPPCCSVR